MPYFYGLRPKPNPHRPAKVISSVQPSHMDISSRAVSVWGSAVAIWPNAVLIFDMTKFSEIQ